MNCLNCGKELVKYQKKYCSISCENRHRYINKSKIKVIKTKVCEYCGKDFEYKDSRQRFCNHKCSTIFNNLKRGISYKGKYKCIVCGKEFTPSKYDSKFCSINCRDILNYNKNIENLNDNKYVSPRFIRKYLFEKYDNKCCKCGWNIKNIHTNKIPLQVHHIDGNWKNNKKDNLELLCPNCHSLTDNFGSRNKYNGYADRRTKKYYEMLKKI